jgi:hypothetical protein
METEQPGKPVDPEFIAWAKQRMNEMDAEAEAATKELGLPPERKFDVLRILYGGRRLTHDNPIGEKAPNAPLPGRLDERK